MKRKSLDISKLKDAAPARAAAAPPLGKILAAAALLSLLLAAIYFFLPRETGAAEQKIDIYLISPQHVMEKSEVRLSVFSSCGAFSTFVDGKPLESGVQSAKLSSTFPPGEHLFEARNENCSSNASFTVERQECEDGQTQSCSEGACNGTMRCHGGRWGSCDLPKKVCSPGQRIGCSTDGCRFGYKTCNPCGSGFGECLPDAAQGNASSCTGNGCT